MPRAHIVNQVIQDVRYGGRMLLRHPGATAIIVLSLALGIGANTVVFSLVNALLLQTLPYPDSDRLVAVWFTPPNQPGARAPSSPGSCIDIRERSAQAFEHVGCYIGVSGNVSDPATPDAGPRWLRGEMFEQPVTSALGVKPELGRWFTREEDAPGAQRVMLISHRLWQEHFGGAQDILGRTLRVADFSGDDSPSTIIGVMPDGFGLDNPDGSDYFIPLRNSGQGRRSPVRNRAIVARLQPGTTIPQAQASMDILAPVLGEITPMNKDWGLSVQPLLEARIGDVRSPLAILEGVAAVVLLIACANVGGLLLAQGMTRQREIAVRTAIGSSRARVVRQLLTESVVLALTGAAVSVLVLIRGVPALASWLSLASGTASASLNTRVLAFTLIVSIVTALLFGILPALQASRPDLTTAFKDGDRSSTAAPAKLMLRSSFVVLQISLAVVLLTGAGLLINSLVRLNRVDAGFNPNGLTTFQMNFTGQQFFHQTGNVTPSGSLEFEMTPRIDATATDIRQRLRGVPGVEGVTAIADTLPLAGGARQYNFTIEDGSTPAADNSDFSAQWLPIAPDYFSVIQAPVLRGREFDESDRRGGAPVALINATMAAKYWPNADPIGQTIAVQFFNDVPRQIVGIVGDVRQNITSTEMPAQMYVPFAQLPTIQEGRTAFGLEVISFLVRSRAPLKDWLPAATTMTTAADPLHAMSNVLTLNQFVASRTASFRQYVVLLGVFSGIALLLAVVGIYGVMSQSVAQRSVEIGIRMAFGADARNVLMLVLRQGLIVIGIGVIIGTAAALGLTRFINGLLWGITASDPATYAAVMATIAAAALVACLVPAYRALKVDPLTAIRRD